MLLDVSSFGLTGRQAESALLQSGIVTNRNSIPRDPNGAWFTSGIRMGTPALTTRGLGTDEMDVIADLIATVLKETSPGVTAEGKPGKVKYQLDEKVADRVATPGHRPGLGLPPLPGHRPGLTLPARAGAAAVGRSRGRGGSRRPHSRAAARTTSAPAASSRTSGAW